MFVSFNDDYICSKNDENIININYTHMYKSLYVFITVPVCLKFITVLNV